MPPALFVRGFVIGFSIAATIGPMAVLCIRRTLAQGRIAGLVTGLGVATADGCYGAVAGFGLTLISHFLLAEQMWLRLIGGLFLCYLGGRTILTPPATHAAMARGTTIAGAYASALALTLTNPLTILSFIAIFAGLGAVQSSGSIATTFLVVGVFSGSALWWVILTTIVGVLREHLTSYWLGWINRASGTVILLFGIIALSGLL